MKFFGTNSGAFGDRAQDVAFPQTAGSSGIMGNVPLLVFGVNGCASGEKQYTGLREESSTLSRPSTAESTHMSIRHTESC